MRNFFQKIKNFIKSGKEENLYQLDGMVPLGKALPFSISHILTMFVANITPIILILANTKGINLQFLILNTIFISGIVTLLQTYPLYKFGSRLPLVAGASFTFLGVLSSITLNYGPYVMFGSVIVGGLVMLIFGFLAKFWVKLISPLVSAIVVFAIGLSLIPTGIISFCGGQNIVSSNSVSFKYLLVGFSTLITYLIFNSFGKGIWKNLSMLLGIIVGYLVALCFNNMVSFDAFKDISFITYPKFINLKKIEFNFEAILTVSIIYIISSTEVLGVANAFTSFSLKRNATKEEITGGITLNGAMSSIGGLFGVIPFTLYAQNVGIYTQTKVINRKVILITALILIVAGLFPPFAALIQTIPDSVLGGITILLFVSIMITGLKMIAICGFSERNIIILTLSLAFGYGFNLMPDIYNTLFNDSEILKLIFGNTIASMFIISFILDLVLPKEKRREKI